MRKKYFFSFILISVFVPITFTNHSYGQPQATLSEVVINPTELSPGEMMSIECSLSLTQKIEKRCFLFLHLEGSCPGAYVNADIHSPGLTELWKPDKKIALGPFYVYVPIDLPEGEYRITMGLAYGKKTLKGVSYVKIPYTSSANHDWVVGNVTIRKRPSFSQSYENKEDYKVAVRGPLEKIFPEKKYFQLQKEKEKASLRAARGEYENFQVVLIPGTNAIKGVTVITSDLRSDDRASVIGKENIALYKVGYVKTKKPYYNTVKVGQWPDPLITLQEAVDVKKDLVQPIWVNIYVPRDAGKGTYRGTIKVIASDGTTKKINVMLKVWDFSIPKRPNLKTAFDFYEYSIHLRHPKGKYENHYLWKAKIERLTEKYYLDMLKHRISPIHNVGNPRFLGEADGEYGLNFSDFDERVRFYLQNGQTSFGIAKEWPHNDKEMWSDAWYGYTDEKAAIGVFQEYGRHLEEMGWLDIAYAYIFDETFNRVRDFTRLIHQGNPGIKNLVTATPQEGYPDVDIWCVRINNVAHPNVAAFKKNGASIWMYVAGTTRPYPNLNLDVPAIEHRIIPWMCWKYDIEGLLYWSVNYWAVVNPWESAMTFGEQNGNGSLYYPDPEQERPIGSIRLEVLRDGLEDYEYFFVLKELVKTLKRRVLSGKYSGALSEAEAILGIDSGIITSCAYYTRDGRKLYDERRKVGALIEQLQRACSVKDTEYLYDGVKK